LLRLSRSITVASEEAGGAERVGVGAGEDAGGGGTLAAGDRAAAGDQSPHCGTACSQRLRRRAEKTRRHAPAPIERDASRVVVREADHVERLAYTQTQGAAALGISRSTLARRVLPFVETIEIGWGTYVIPVDELDRFASERRRKASADRRPSARPGRKVALGVEVATRIRDERAAGKSLADIARGLNADGVPTSQGGRQWWPSTVRAVLVRSSPPKSAKTSKTRIDG
jgi:hypothetical protein